MPNGSPGEPQILLAVSHKASRFGMVAWSPDGRSVAAAAGEIDGDGMIWVWHLDREQPLRLEGHNGNVRSIAWSPDGVSIASGSDDNTVRVWDAGTGRERRRLEGHGNLVRSVAWSPDGTSLASGSVDKTVRVWDVGTGRERHRLEGHGSAVQSVAWSPDGASIASGSLDKTVRVWDVGTGQERHRLEGHGNFVWSVAWSPDGASIASGSYDNTVRVWDAGTGRERHRLEGHSNFVWSVAWSPDGASIASGSDDKTVGVWDAGTGRERRRLEGHGRAVRSVAWSPDGASLASGSVDKTVRVWNAGTGRERHRLEGHGDVVWSVAWSPDGASLASGAYDETVRVWDAGTGRERRRLEGHGNLVRSVAWSPDGASLASGSVDKTVRVWDAGTGRERHRLEGHGSLVQSVAWSPDGASLASGSFDETVRVWDAGTGRERHRLEGHGNVVWSVAWSPDGASLASGSFDETVRVWDAGTGRERHRLEGHSNFVWSVAWSPDGASLASGSSDKTVRVWDAGTGRERHRLEGHSDFVQSVAWSPDGASLASGSGDKTVRVWDAGTGRERHRLEGHGNVVWSVAWSPDGNLLASATYDGEIRLWNAKTGQFLGTRPPLPFTRLCAGVTFGVSRGAWSSETFEIIAWKPQAKDAASVAPVQVLQASAKIVLAGDSNAGKTSLALRLAENRFEGDQSSTHGMQIWTLAPEKLHPEGTAPAGQLREVFLWDLGGQEEYQLVNQLFLHETSIALILFDASRGNIGLESVRRWSHKLAPEVQKLLIRSRADEGGSVADSEIEHLRKDLSFGKYIATSAKENDNGGIAELRGELHRLIDWDNVVLTTRPASFQTVRDHVTRSRQAGTCILYLADLSAKLREEGVTSDQDLETALGHLSREGEIVSLQLQSGDRVVILRVDVLSRYAGVIVQAARKQARGVPAVEQARILSPEMDFTRLKAEERLSSRFQERMVLEAAVRLMIERGICFDHQGLLIFPTLFDDYATHEGSLPAAAPIYYDFNGPIDNIYAALVAKLAIGGKFGPVRLWARYAEFGSEASGRFGLRRTDTGSRGHLDLYFDDQAAPELQILFRDFVQDHLTSEGVRVVHGRGFACEKCGNSISEEDVQYRIENKFDSVQCQRCEARYSLFHAASTSTPESIKALVAFKTDVEERTRSVERKVADTMDRPRKAEAGKPLRILHLSDLHFNSETKRDSVLQPLVADLRENLGVEKLDYLVVSGDFADKCSAAGFDRALEFLEELLRRFDLNPLRTILVPGNHDLERNFEHYGVSGWAHGKTYKDGHQEGQVVFEPNEKYIQRFDTYRRFYHSFYSAKEYPLEPERQFELVEDKETGLAFLGLNSAWRVDQFRPERAALNNDALSSALLQYSKKVPLGIAVWHHAMAGDRKIADTRATERLADAGFRLVLHGDVHEDRDGIHGHLDPRRTIHVVGGGAFGAAAKDRPESTPRLYTLLQVRRDLSSIQVFRRHQKTAEGAYDEYAVYPMEEGKPGKRGDFTIRNTPRASSVP